MLPDRFTARNVRRVLRDPRLVFHELNRVGIDLDRAFYRRFDRAVAWDPMDADWDNLLLLDACRYDCYREQTPFDAPVERRTSPGGDSWEFMEAAFVGREHHDTVYVTANPHAYRLGDDVFHFHRNLLEDAWNPDAKTVLPEDVAAAARDAHERFPRKRLLVHFMQPHAPFLGETGRRIDEAGLDPRLDEGANRRGALTVWGKLRYGLLDRDLVWEAYRENLDVVLRTVHPLVDDLTGRTVVSTDHGNLFGERLRPIPARGYGHPRNLRAPALVEIPWQALPAEDRRNVRADPPVADERPRPPGDVVDRRLRELGYAT